MNSHRPKILLAVLLISGAYALSACGPRNSPPASAPTEEVFAVRTAAAKVVQTVRPVIASGMVASETEARLAFKTGGIIDKIWVKEGETVNKGTLLATLNLTEISAQAEQAKEGAEKARRDYERAKQLFQDSVATSVQVENARTAYEVARRNVEIASFNLTLSEIRAPANGKIVRKTANSGEMIGPGQPVFLFYASGNDNWVMRVGVADKDWVRLRVADSARLVFDAFPQETYPAVVYSLAQGADMLSGLYQVELKLAPLPKGTPPPTLAAGFFVSATIFPSLVQRYVEVPVEALIEGSGNSASVFVPEQGKAKRVPVRLAFLQGRHAYLAEGLSGGEQVIIEGAAFLSDGAAIRGAAIRGEAQTP